jgi:hypothetical protein
MAGRIAAMVFVLGLTPTAQVAAQQVLQPPIWPGSSTTFSTANEPATDRFPTQYSGLLSANTGEHASTIPDKSLIGDDATTPFQANTWTGNHPAYRDDLQLAGLFKAESSKTAAAKRLPFYVTAPYWLPRSRPFPNNSTSPAQPAARNGLINDVATLIWPGSRD